MYGKAPFPSLGLVVVVVVVAIACPQILPFTLSHPRSRNSASKPLAFDSAPLIIFVRSLPPFPLYSLAGAVNGGIGEVRTVLRTAAILGQLGRVSEACQKSS